MPSVVLTTAYTLHMAATAIWIGGLFFLVLLLPAATHRLDPKERRVVDQAAVRRFLPLAWLCLAVFVATGLTQMSASPRYEGVLAVGNPWSVAILLKHIVIAGMLSLLAWQTWGLHPSLERAAVGLDSASPGRIATLERRQRLSLTLSLVLGALVMGLTAVARASA